MAYNTVAIKKDLEGKPIPQIYNPVSNEYEVLQGLHGASKTILHDSAGNAINLVTLITDIINSINTSGTTQLRPGTNNIGKVEVAKNLMEYYGKSNEVKPTTNIIKGSTYFEIDTSKVFMYDGAAWVVI